MITISINPVAFTIGSVSVRWYGIIIALAIIEIVLWMLRKVRKEASASYETVLTGALVCIPSGIVVSKLLHVIDNIVIAKLHPEFVLIGKVVDYTQHPGLIFSAAGLTTYGAILGATLGMWIYSKVSKFQFGYVMGLMAPSIILAQAIGRIGCTINGCCYGIATSLPWGVVYTHPDSIAFGVGVVHPTQVYELIYDLIIFGILLKLKERLKPDGSLFLVYLSLYSLWRLGIGFLREGTPFLFGLHEAQFIAIIVLAISISLLAYRTRWTSPSDHLLLFS